MNKLLEQLAALEHEQWTHWTAAVNPTHPLLNVPYDELTDEEKEKDRYWARKVLECMEEGEWYCPDCKRWVDLSVCEWCGRVIDRKPEGYHLICPSCGWKCPRCGASMEDK